MKTLPAADVVIVGAGWTGLLMAKELGSRTALSVVVLERGGQRKSIRTPWTSWIMQFVSV
jgi:gluconate 2-dehydrogenase alpha chain